MRKQKVIELTKHYHEDVKKEGETDKTFVRGGAHTFRRGQERRGRRSRSERRGSKIRIVRQEKRGRSGLQPC